MDGIFYAKLICVKDDKEYSIDSRTSDAIAMAVRFRAPIYTYEFIMEAAGVVLDDPEIRIKASEKEKPKASKATSIEQLSDKALENLLQKALEKEDYEKAAEIRDEIKRRESGSE